MALIAVIYLVIFAVAGLYLVLLERRVAAWFQLRLGPNKNTFYRVLTGDLHIYAARRFSIHLSWVCWS